MTTRLQDDPADHLAAAAGTAGGDGSGARLRVLSMLREALQIIDEELDEGVVGAKLSECIERLAEASWGKCEPPDEGCL